MVFTTGPDKYRKVINGLKESEIEANWHVRKEKRPLRAIIKGILTGIGKKKIKDLT